MRLSLKLTRDEILENDLSFNRVGAETERKLSKGQTVTAVYDGVVNVSTFKTLGYMPDEMVQIKNAINALYVIYGDKCLKSKFLTKELVKMLPYMLIDTVMTEKATKYYSYKNGVKEYVSEKQDLYNQEINAVL